MKQLQIRFFPDGITTALPKELQVSFYTHCVESVLTYCIPVWAASCPALQKVINTTQKIITWLSRYPQVDGTGQLKLK